MNITKIDESLIVLSKINIKQAIKSIKKKLNIEITDDEVIFYKKYLKITPLGKSLIFYYYAKYFDGYRDLNSINIDQYVKLMILMKRALQIRGDIWLPQIISGGISGKINARTIHNAKLIEKIQNSEVYQDLVKNKYSTLQSMGKSDAIIGLLSTLLNTQFTYCDFDMFDKYKQDIEVDFDQLAQEFLDFVNMI